MKIIFAAGHMLAGFVQIPGPVAGFGCVQNGRVDNLVFDRIVTNRVLKIDVAHKQGAAIDQTKHAAGRAELLKVPAGVERTGQFVAVIDPIPVPALKVPPAAGRDRFHQAAEQPFERTAGNDRLAGPVSGVTGHLPSALAQAGGRDKERRFCGNRPFQAAGNASKLIVHQGLAAVGRLLPINANKVIRIHCQLTP